MKKLLIPLIALLLASCVTEPPRRPPEPITDTDIVGTWQIKSAELAGKNLPMPPTFELRINANLYAAGVAPTFDRGKLVFFGDELAGQVRRMDVLGEEGPNKGKRYPTIYRMNGRELEICYDLSQKDRPTDFVSREGTMVLGVTYVRK